MGYKLHVSLTRQDRAHSTPGSAGACLLATALQREYGGDWSVTAGSITQAVGEQCAWEGRASLPAQGIIARYDMTSTASVNRRVHVATGTGKYRDRAPRRIEQPGDGPVRGWHGPSVITARLAGGGAVLGSIALILDGFAWGVFAVLGVISAGLITVTVKNVKAGNAHLAGKAAPQKYIHVQEPAGEPATAAVEEREDGFMPEPAGSYEPAAPAFSEPGPVPARASLGSERLYTSPGPEEVSMDAPAAPGVPAAAPAPPAAIPAVPAA